MTIQLSERSLLLLRLCVLTAMILLLWLVAILSSVIIAETTQGVVTAVNQSGSQHMQSFRIASGQISLVMPEWHDYPHHPLDLIEELKQRFYSPPLTDAIPTRLDHKLHLAYEQVAEQWWEVIGPLIRWQANTHSGTSPIPAGMPTPLVGAREG